VAAPYRIFGPDIEATAASPTVQDKERRETVMLAVSVIRHF
jgi:hypothetical protein